MSIDRLRAYAAKAARELTAATHPTQALVVAVEHRDQRRVGFLGRRTETTIRREPRSEVVGWPLWSLVDSTHEFWDGQGTNRRRILREQWRLARHIWLDETGSLIFAQVDHHRFNALGTGWQEWDALLASRPASDEDLRLPDSNWRSPRDFALSAGGQGLYFERGAWIAPGGRPRDPGSTLSGAITRLRKSAGTYVARPR